MSPPHHQLTSIPKVPISFTTLFPCLVDISHSTTTTTINTFTLSSHSSNKAHMLFRRGLATASRRKNGGALSDSDVVVVSFARTPIASVGSKLSSITAPYLGSHAVKAALSKIPSLPKEKIQEAFMGNVLSAGLGQAPTRQAILYAGLGKDTPCTTVNKVCASGMKAVMFASLSITSGYRDACIAGGMESMSNVPYYLPPAARSGLRMGNNTLIDGMIHDGLWDPYNDSHMGFCGDLCADTYGISRHDQDQFALQSYERAAKAWDAGKFSDEVVPIEVPGKRGQPPVIVTHDEEYPNVNAVKLRGLKPAFKKDGGSITAANSSKINDGAAAMVVISGKLCRELSLQPLFRILGFGDAAKEPAEFTTAPAAAIPRALAHAGVNIQDIQYHEINEAFAVVPLVNARILDLDLNCINVHGGAVALGHPIGCSGARIIGTLYSVLKHQDATLGCASICNGGGGASAIVIERLT